jgi:hypothetical protein
MSTQDKKKLGQSPVNKSVSNTDMLHDAWVVMKPFVHFSVKAMQLLAHTLIFIVKSIPKPEQHKPVENTDGKVIKI